MADDNGGKEGIVQLVEKGEEELRIEIRFFPTTGMIKVEGPITNKFQCYGLLKLAEKVIDSQGTQMVKVGNDLKNIPLNFNLRNRFRT